ncbi:MAG: glycosyltransferase family 4 protein [Candidatus Binatia bacterium]
MGCRLLYLVGQLHTGGLERQLYYLLQSMDRERYEPVVATWNYAEEDFHLPPIRALGIPIYSLAGYSSAFDKFRAFRRLAQQLRPQVVHSYSFYTNIAAAWATWGTQATALGSVRNDFTSEKKDAGLWLGRLSARWPRAQICNSYAAAETCRYSQSAFIPKYLHVVQNGLDLERFRLFPFSTSAPVSLLGVGYLLPAKRWDRLLVAARELKHQGLSFAVRIAGDGPLRTALEQQARTLGVADCVTFLGHVDDVARLLAETTFVVHTADNEGCPNAVMEAMACGRAVVSTDAGDVPFLVDDGTTGFVVHRSDSMKLVERLATLMSNRDLCGRMGGAGRLKAEQEFGLDRFVERTFAAYQAAGWLGLC